MQTVLVLCFFAAYAASAAGWGHALRRVLHLGPVAVAPALDATLGLAVLAMLGGWLNLARLAYGPALLALLVLGLGLLAAGLRAAPPDLRRLGPWLKEGAWAPVLLVAGAGVYVAATVVPAAALNFHDDLQKYLVFPVRMLQTGTLLGSPLSGIGHETLGAQALLQAPALVLFPPGAVNGFDALLCLALLLALGARTVREGGALTAAGCAAALVAVNPQTVNVSSLYSGACLIGALLLLSRLERPSEEPAGRRFLVEGLLLGGLVALKTTYLLFGAAWALALLAEKQDLRGLLRRVGFTAAGAGAALLPWLAVHAPHYFRALGAAAGAPAPPARFLEPVSLLSFRPTLYGSGYGPYTLLALGLAVAALVALWRLRAEPGTRFLAALLVAIAALYPVNLHVLAPRLAGLETSLRYFVPLLLGVLPTAVALAERALRGHRLGEAAPLAALLGLCALFAGSLQARVEQAAHSGSTLAFTQLATRPDYLAYCAQALGPSEQSPSWAAQQRIPAGASVVAWVSSPAQLDFRRNPIAQVDTGAGTPWAEVPAAEYLLWEHQGYAVRSLASLTGLLDDSGAQDRLIGLRWLQLYRAFEEARDRGTLVEDRDGVAVVRLSGPVRADWRQRPLTEVTQARD